MGSARDGDAARDHALAQRVRESSPARFLADHQTTSAALAFALLVLVYLWPALVGGELLSPISALYQYAPWLDRHPADLSGYFNYLLTDVSEADYPWRFLVRELLHQGTLPAWNPYVFGGIPLYSNPQTGLFSIFSLPLWILPLNYGIGVGAALKLWAAAFGTYLLVRELKLGFLAGLLAGVAFAFSALNIVWLTHETLPAVAALLPWMLWLIERIFQGRGLGSALALAVATAAALGGGHPGMQVHVLAVGALYALLRAVVLGRETPRAERLRPLGVAAGGLALGVLLVGAMLVPEAMSTRGTIGTAARDAGTSTLPGTEMPLTTIRTTLFPDWWGRPSGMDASNPPITELSDGLFIGVNYNERTLYAGVVALLLALVGIAARGGWRRKAPFAALAFLGLAVPLHFPGVYQIVTNLPAFELVQNQRLHFVWALGVAVLAAFGLQAVIERPQGDRWRLLAMLGALLVGLIALVGTGASGGDIADTIEHFATGRDFQSNGVLALTSTAWYLLLALGVGAALVAAKRWPRRVAAVGAAVVLLAVVDALHFAGDYQPMAPASKSIPPRTPAIEYLQEHRDEGRMIALGDMLPNDWLLTYGLYDVRGYDPPQPTRRFFELWRAVNSNQLDWLSFRMNSGGPDALQLASVLGARHIVTEPGTGIGKQDAYHDYLKVVYEGEDATILENARAVPRVLVPATIRVTDDEPSTRATLLDIAFDPLREVVVERAEGEATALANSGGDAAPGTASVVEEANARVRIRAQLDRRALVVLNDNWADGWSVHVDGEQAQQVRVNDVMRGVIVPAGTHDVEWRYRVPGLRVGAALSLLALALLAAGLVVMVRRRRTQS
ncbi:MAG TPA: YfhO family protein [Polyangiales bacterium]|nr:YfhO family protein [Polyangiales bacterium]